MQLWLRILKIFRHKMKAYESVDRPISFFFFFSFLFIGYIIIIIIIIVVVVVSGECAEILDAPHVLETDAYGRNALHHACAAGNVKMITKLLNKGVSINLRTKAGKTPLLCAKIGGHVDAVSVLLSKGMFFTF